MSEKECIYREDAIKAIYEELAGLEDGDTIGAENLRDALYAVPAVQVREVVRGFWIPRYQHGIFTDYQCNGCKYQSRYTTKFCPNCGADMRELVPDTDVGRKEEGGAT